MASITIPEITARTTTDGTAYSHGVVAATGRTPADALGELDAVAHTTATGLADALPDCPADDARPGAWGLELVDVRLVPGPADGDTDGWCAYGTLRSTGLSPLIPEDIVWHDRR
jgi:hypothetical protein